MASQDTFADDVAEHLSLLRWKAYQMTRSHEDSEDLIQETLLKAYRRYDSFTADTNLKAWLMKILTNSYINQYRKAERSPKTTSLEQKAANMGESVQPAELVPAPTTDTDDPERSYEANHIADLIKQVIRELNPVFRVVILLRDIESLSYAEITEAVGIPIGTVESRLYRARQALRQSLAKSYQGHQGERNRKGHR